MTFTRSRAMLLAVWLGLSLAACDRERPADEICLDRCGDGQCQEMVCLGSGCPCAESADSCPQDCAKQAP